LVSIWADYPTAGEKGMTGNRLAAAEYLSLAAAPVFAVMALLTATHGGGPADILCSATHGSSPLTGMVPMYALMSLFHAAPWLRLITGSRSRA
jgi:hypothetical protein